jgi:hypothetical protein
VRVGFEAVSNGLFDHEDIAGLKDQRDALAGKAAQGAPDGPFAAKVIEHRSARLFEGCPHIGTAPPRPAGYGRASVAPCGLFAPRGFGDAVQYFICDAVDDAGEHGKARGGIERGREIDSREREPSHRYRGEDRGADASDCEQHERPIGIEVGESRKAKQIAKTPNMSA